MYEHIAINTEVADAIISTSFLSLISIFGVWLYIKYEGFKEVVEKIVVAVERDYINESGKGHEKYEDALERLYINSFLNKFVSKELYSKIMKRLIEKCVKELPKLLFKH